MSGTALDSWEVENPVPSLEGGAEAGQGTDGSGVIMFNNYTKGEVEGKLAGNDIRNEDETQARTRSNIQKRKARGSDMGSSKPSSAASRTRRHQSGDPSRPQSSNSMVNFSSDEPVPDANSSTATKRPRRKKRRRRKHDKGEKMHNNKPNRKSAKLLSVNDMFKLGFGKQHSGHLNAHRGHTPRKTSGYTLAEAGPGTRVFALTGTPRLGKETLVDTLLDFPIPDPRERPRTVSPRTRKAREAQWNKMREDAEMIRRAVSRGTRRSSLASAGGADDGRATTAGSMNPEDPAVTLLKEKQASEDREIKEALASSMGLTVEEMDALDASANADTEDAINEYLEAFHRIDADGSGSLSPEELKSVMNELGEDMNEAELEEMIREADTDGDGEIDYDEFTGMMRARKRRELLARNMTKAQAGHRKNSSRGHRTLQHSERKSIIPEVNDGSAMLAQFEEMTGTRQSYPQGGAPSLPPLQLSKATIAKRHIRNGAVASSQFMDRFLTRPTPHVLKTGAAASADKLRIQLTKAQDIIHMLDKKVEEGIEWVQQNCPVTNIKAQLYCQKWGLEKLTELFNKIAYRQMIAAIEKWCEFVDYHVNQEKAENYLKFKGSRRLVKMLEDFDLKQKAGGWDKWVHVMLAERQLEQNKAATDINRVVRGFLGRRRVLNICTGRAAIEIQRVARGRMGRNRYKKIWQEHREEWAAMVIQVRYRGYKGKQLGKIIMKKKREYDAACVLQRAWRGFEGRRITRLIAQKKKELEAVLYIQGAWRSRVARKLVATMRAAIAEEESALYIQAWWRAVLGYREGQARLIAHRTQVAREEAALKIQGAWRIFAARKKVEHARLVRACLRVQCAWRCKKGRFTLHLKRAAKKELEREEAEAASKMQSLFRGRNARRRIAQQKEEANAATTIQGRFRSRMAKKTLAQKRYQAEQSRKRSEQRALEDRMALRIQCAWRGKQGRLGAHLRAQAQKARDEEEAKAAQAIQARIRGRLTRKEIREADEKRRKEAEAAIQQAKRDKAKATEEAHAAQLIQARFRGQQARSEIDELRAAKALEDQRKFEDEMAAEQRKKEAEEQAAKEAAMKKQLELLKKQKEQEEAEQAHAAVMIQQRIRARAAQNELQKRKEQHALELAAETDAAARAKLRERQQREIAAVKLQQQFRSRHARKEVAARRAKLEADKRRLAAEALRHKQDLAALKIQGMARRWQARRDMKKKLDDRQKEIEAKLKAEQEAVEQEHAALVLQKRMRVMQAKKSVDAKRAEVEAERAALEAERLELEEQARASTKLQAMFRAKKAKEDVNKRRAQHDAEMAVLKKRNAAEEELKALRLKQEQELAAMKLQAIYRGRKHRSGFEDFKSKRLVEINARKKKLHGELSAIKIQGMYRGWKARKELKKRMDAVKRRRKDAKNEEKDDAFRNPQHKDNWLQYWDEGSQCHYYFNKVTQETAWDAPTGGFTVADDLATDYDTDNPNTEWADWVKKTDPQSGNDYWYNNRTGATEWCDFIDEDGDGVDDRWDPIHGDDWEERVTADGQEYYYNKATGVTQWKDFVDADGDGIDDRWDPVHDDDWEQRLGSDGVTYMWYNLKTGEEYPVEDGGAFDWADWEEATDPNTGALYWKNKLTGEVQWE